MSEHRREERPDIGTVIRHDLSSDEAIRLSEARNWFKGHFSENPDPAYADCPTRLHALQTILDKGWIESSETWKLQALGVALGDCIAEKLMLDWVSVEDEDGRDLALNWPGTQILSYPFSMISKRIQRGESVDVQYLLDEVCKVITEMAHSGRYV